MGLGGFGLLPALASSAAPISLLSNKVRFDVSTDEIEPNVSPSDHPTRVSRIRSRLLSASSDLPLVAAHRGNHVTEPENSIRAIQAAIDVGVDIVELDVKLSREGIPILMHDDTLDRTTDGTGDVANVSLADLSSIRLRYANGEISDVGIPTLRSALLAARDRIFVNLDLKVSDIEPVIEAIRDVDMMEQVMFFHFDSSVLRELQNLVPDALVMPMAMNADDALRRVAEQELRLIHLKESFNSPELAGDLDLVGAAGWTNALGEADETARREGPAAGFAAIIANRPDVIQTDYPAMLIAYLRTHAATE